MAKKYEGQEKVSRCVWDEPTRRKDRPAVAAKIPWGLIVGVLLWLGPRAADASGSDFELAENMDYFGDDLPGFSVASDDLYQCINACRSEAVCKAFTYAPPGVVVAQARCWLKSAVPNAVPKAGLISGKKLPAPPLVINLDPPSMHPQIDLPGPYFARILLPEADPANCAIRCGNATDCRAYTYVRPGVQGPAALCYLKSSALPSKKSDCCTSGLKGWRPSTIDDVSLEPETDLPGRDYKFVELDRSDPRLCAEACRADSKCGAYTFGNSSDSSSARCWLKESAPPAKWAPGFTSGIRAPDTELGGWQTALTRGLPFSPGMECDQGEADDVFSRLCSGANLLPGFKCSSKPQSTCKSYWRQIAVGASASSVGFLTKTRHLKGYDAYGGRGRLLGEAALCALRELSPKFPLGGTGPGFGGPVDAELPELDIGIGALSFRQRLGYLDFDPEARQFTGYRNLRFCAPIVGCYDAVAQDLKVRLETYKIPPPIAVSVLQGGGGSFAKPALDSFWAFTVITETSEKSVELSPPAFTVATPVGPVEVQPKFTYGSEESVQAPPFQNEAGERRPDNDGPGLGWPHAATLQDVFGADYGIAIPVMTTMEGWQSQLAFGNRDPRADGDVWQPSGSPVVRPDRDPKKARSDAEKRSSVEMGASARLTYPKAGQVDSLLPDWLPAGSVKFGVWVEPKARAAFSGQFDFLAAEANTHRNSDLGVSPWWRGADVSLGTSAAGAFSLDVRSGLDLTVKVKFFGTIVDVHAKMPALQVVPEKSSFRSGPKAYFASNRTASGSGDPYTRFQTFRTDLAHDPLAQGPGYVEACLASSPVLPEPAPDPGAQPGDPKKLFRETEEVPCNICTYWQGKSHLFFPVSRPPGAKVWQCDREDRNGCHDVCSLDTATGELTYLRPPDATIEIKNDLTGEVKTGYWCFQKPIR